MPNGTAPAGSGEQIYKLNRLTLVAIVGMVSLAIVTVFVVAIMNDKAVEADVQRNGIQIKAGD